MRPSAASLDISLLAALDSRPTSVEIIMGDQMCIKYIRVCTSFVPISQAPCSDGDSLIQEGGPVINPIGVLLNVVNRLSQICKQCEINLQFRDRFRKCPHFLD